MLKLSIIIPCYNCEQTLREAVESCYQQGFATDEFEIIMVNDGSTDNTYTLMENLANEYKNIRIFQHEKNQGGGAARNTAVAKTKSEVIFCLDSDDILGHQTLAMMLSFLIKNKLDGVCLEKLISFKGTDRNDISHETTFPNTKIYTLEDLIEREYPCGLNAVFMFTKHAFVSSGGYPVSHGFDTQGFAWRFIAHGCLARSCPGTIYYHRVNHSRSYYLREYASGHTNINMKAVILEHDYLLKEDVRNAIIKTDARDFTKPINNLLQSFPKIFHENALAFIKEIPPHVHDKPLSDRPIRPNSLSGIMLRIKSRMVNKNNTQERVCIVNYADGIYIKGQERLKQSLSKIGNKYDIIFHTDLDREHNQNIRPMGFKADMISEAQRQGYDIVIWLDANMIAVRPLKKIVKLTKRDGVFAFSRYSSSVGEYSSDLALAKVGLLREEALKIPELTTCILAVDFRHEKGRRFSSEFQKMADDGETFIGVPKPYNFLDTIKNDTRIVSKDPRVKGHRHDQTAASIIVNRLSIKPYKYYCFDLEGERKKSNESYADFIPLDVLVVQNRDIKNTQKEIVRELDKFWNKRGLPKLIQIIRNILLSLRRYIRDSIKYILYRKRWRLIPYEKHLDTFVKIIKNFGLQKNLLIVEVGSRDAAEAVALYEKFPQSTVVSFECNPDTIDICKNRISGIENIKLIEKAASDEEGEFSFWQERETANSWNPGISSLMKPNEGVSYYKMEEITVPTTTIAKELDNLEIISGPDVLWMDSQGGELKALKGLGSRLGNVSFIHTEVEFIPAYDKQPLFKDILEYLNDNGFDLLTFTTRGKAAADAVFVNRKKYNRVTPQIFTIYWHWFLEKITGKTRSALVKILSW